jgi:hypothetical protein
VSDPVEQFNLWQFEYSLIDTALQQIEQEERKILQACGVWPPTEVGAFAVVNGERPEAWRASRELARVREAMFILPLITKTRSQLELGHGSPSRAAHTALLVGLHANAATAQAALCTLQQQRSQKGGAVRGHAAALRAAQHDATIRRHYIAWLSSDRLQLAHRTATPYIAKKTGLKAHVVRRRLKLLT